MSLQPDDVILNGKYRILRLIGEGGMARVWLVEELTFGRRVVALKEPRAHLLPEAAVGVCIAVTSRGSKPRHYAKTYPGGLMGLWSRR